MVSNQDEEKGRYNGKGWTRTGGGPTALVADERHAGEEMRQEETAITREARKKRADIWTSYGSQ
jgi:hypothetical protein